MLDCQADYLVNPVNCAGVMGKGLALQFAQRFPEILPRYRTACEKRTLRPGTVQIAYARWSATKIVNFPTKDDWRAPSRLEWISAGLDTLAHELGPNNPRSIAFPPLGCGLGGLDWDQVRPLIEAFAAHVPHMRVFIFGTEA